MSLYATYHGRAVYDAETIERPEKSPMVRARLAVNIAGPNARKENHAELMEWVNVIPFSKRCREDLEGVRKGGLVAVMGSVTVAFYKPGTGNDASAER